MKAIKLIEDDEYGGSTSRKVKITGSTSCKAGHDASNFLLLL